MELIELFLDFSNGYFRPLLILVTSSFAIYFAFKKVGNSITVQFSVASEGFSASRINEIILSNNKDKPVSIYSLYATFDNDLLLELKRFSPPEILKPYETIGIFTDQYSKLRVNDDEFAPNFIDAEIWIESAEKTIKCTARKRSNLLKGYKKVSKDCFKFNGFVYDDTVSYILNYRINNKLKTAFIHYSGYIGNEWDFQVNHLGSENDVTPDKIIEMLESNGFHDLFSNYQLVQVLLSGWKTEVVANKHEKVFESDE